MAGEYPVALKLFLYPFSVLFLQTPVYTSLPLSMLSEAPTPQSVSPTHVSRRKGLWLSSSSCAIWVPEQPRAYIKARVVTEEGRRLCPCLGFMPVVLHNALCVYHLPDTLRKSVSSASAPALPPRAQIKVGCGLGSNPKLLMSQEHIGRGEEQC